MSSVVVIVVVMGVSMMVMIMLLDFFSIVFSEHTAFLGSVTLSLLVC